MGKKMREERRNIIKLGEQTMRLKEDKYTYTYTEKIISTISHICRI